MKQDQVTEEIFLRKMNPAASQRILEYLIRELIRRDLLHPEDLSEQLQDPVPEER